MIKWENTAVYWVSTNSLEFKNQNWFLPLPLMEKKQTSTLNYIFKLSQW